MANDITILLLITLFGLAIIFIIKLFICIKNMNKEYLIINKDSKCDFCGGKYCKNRNLKIGKDSDKERILGEYCYKQIVINGY